MDSLKAIRQTLNQTSPSATHHQRVLGLAEISITGSILSNENFLSYCRPRAISEMAKNAADLWDRTVRYLPRDLGRPKFLRLSQTRRLKNSFHHHDHQDPNCSSLPSDSETYKTAYLNRLKPSAEVQPGQADFTEVYTNIDVLPVSGSENLVLVEYEVDDHRNRIPRKTTPLETTSKTENDDGSREVSPSEVPQKDSEKKETEPETEKTDLLPIESPTPKPEEDLKNSLDTSWHESSGIGLDDHNEDGLAPAAGLPKFSVKSLEAGVHSASINAAGLPNRAFPPTTRREASSGVDDASHSHTTSSSRLGWQSTLSTGEIKVARSKKTFIQKVSRVSDELEPRLGSSLITEDRQVRVSGRPLCGSLDTSYKVQNGHLSKDGGQVRRRNF